MPELPSIDARREPGLSEAAAAGFRAAGLLVVRGLVAGEELAALRTQTLALVERAAASRVDDPDYQYKLHAETGSQVPFRIEYVVDKLPACRALLGHPFVLRSVEQLQGPRFIPTWDSMVFKLAGAGAAVEWHRDADTEQCEPGRPIFNVDVYLDASGLDNCLWAIPGSQRLGDEEAERTCRRLGAGGFSTEGAVPVPLEAGDALLHDILLLHGSPAATSELRRVLYYEFRPADVELRRGPHTESYVPAKERVLAACLRDRAAAPWVAGEEPYAAPPERAAVLGASERLASYRVPHHEHWRWDLEKARQERRRLLG
jgi:ectoine hydroxylase-related dioxygenase (phytanoyl-CoA dioxygenase family)